MLPQYADHTLPLPHGLAPGSCGIRGSKMVIQVDGSKGTNNGTTDLIKMPRNLYHREAILLFAPEIS